jgi:LytS/YehU family sensor histidine kinase
LAPLLFQILIGIVARQVGVRKPFPDEYLIYPFISSLAINAIVAVISNSVVLSYKKNDAEKQLQNLKIQQTEAQKKILMQQLQPHFLFNALSTLKSLINENTELAQNYTIKLSAFLRYAIAAQKHDLIDLQHEMDFVADYLCLQKMRFGNALQWHFDIPENHIKDTRVIIFSIQSLIENAIKHNHFTTAKPLIIYINAQNNTLKISNNRQPKINREPLGTGLENLNIRCLLILKLPIKIIDTDAYYTVIIPLKTKK